uniref:Putative pancreatic lipase-like enzyme n=1 Tax=Amblyomma triste TaxID=251400 RepID=A0A023G8K0_AMBTT
MEKRLYKDEITDVLSFILTKQRDYACYKEFGCFSPENRMALEIGGPVSPEEAGVRFYFYGRLSPLGTLVTATNWSNVLHRRFVKNRKALKIVIHGFKESRNTRQVVNLTSTLLQHTRSNVIVVDWQYAARFPYYATAAANSPLVGAELSVLLQSMYNKSSLWPKSVHLIGFSLGAHAAGFCGRHFENATKQKIGRITGLDPAGLLFENPNASLSSADAEFVDVIHTNGGNMNELEFGRKDPMGHVDFYPNGGSYQLGCTAALSDISCSHNRAWWYFIEALQSTCSFKSIPCHNGWNSYRTCLMNAYVKPVQMGSRKVIPNLNGSYYLKTNAKPPYCIEEERFPR